MSDDNDYFLSWAEFHRDTRELAKQLIAEHKGKLPWHGIIGIARGGLIPAAILARELNIRLVDSLCMASYDHNQQGTLKVLKRIEGSGAGFLLVDDLVDSGITAKAVREMLPEAYLVTVYAKPAGRGLTERFIREFPQNTWLHFPWDTAVQFSEPLTGQE